MKKWLSCPCNDGVFLDGEAGMLIRFCDCPAGQFVEAQYNNYIKEGEDQLYGTGQAADTGSHSEHQEGGEAPKEQAEQVWLA